MRIEHKILIFAIASALAAVLAVVAYNTFDASIRVAAHRECVEANKVIAEVIARSETTAFRVTSIPECRTR